MPPHVSLTITKMDSTVQFSCAPLSERSQEIEIQVIVLRECTFHLFFIKKSILVRF